MYFEPDFTHGTRQFQRWPTLATGRRPAPPHEPRLVALGGLARLADRAPARASTRPFGVRLLAQGISSPRHDEAQALELDPRARIWRREVMLMLGDTPWVAARSVAPLTSLHGARLQSLGTRSLGSWLFRQPGLERGPIEIIRSPTPKLVTAHGRIAPWGRRSILRLGRTSILVQEFFLDAMTADLALPSR